AVDQVQYDWEWIVRLRRLIQIINVVGLIAGGVLGIAAAFTIANVIRLTMMLYREEIEIMRLVGATERIIRGPFLIEGFLQGLLWGVLFTGFLPWQKVAALVAGGMVAGWLGSWLSVRARPDAA